MDHGSQKKEKIRTNLTKLRRRIKKTGLFQASKVSRAEAWKQLQIACKEYNNAKKSSVLLRDTFLDSLAQAIADNENIKKESALKRLKNTEKTRRTFRRLHPLKKKQRGNPVIKLYTSADGNRREVVDKQEMEAAMMFENQTRFLQAKNTPFLSPPLLEEVGLLGNSDAAEKILKGTYHHQDLHHMTNEYIKFLKMPSHIKTNETLKTFDINEHIKGWKKAKETTASEPHRLSFSHYKAAINHPDLAAFDYILREIPFRTGFSPKPWQLITDLQIYKKNMEIDVESMRTITLFSADFNINNKLLGQRIIKQAEDKKC